MTVAACHSLQWSRNRSILYWTLIKVPVFMRAVISALCAFPDNPVSLRALPVDEDWHILLFTLLFIRFLGAYSRPEWLGPLVSWWKPAVCLLFCWQDALLCCFPPLLQISLGFRRFLKAEFICSTPVMKIQLIQKVFPVSSSTEWKGFAMFDPFGPEGEQGD